MASLGGTRRGTRQNLSRSSRRASSRALPIPARRPPERASRSTGHAVRTDYAFPPGVGFHNLHLACSDREAEDVIGEAGEGLYVEDLWSQPGTGLRNGLFTFNVRGRTIRSGALSDPIEGAVISESLPRLLLKLRMAGKDLAWGPRGTAGSTTLLEKITVC